MAVADILFCVTSALHCCFVLMVCQSRLKAFPHFLFEALLISQKSTRIYQIILGLDAGLSDDALP